jgi:6-phosphogluconolactonase
MVEIVEHADRETLSRALAERVAQDLRAALDRRGRATLAVPGGGTPGPFLTALGGMALNWDRVAVTPTDERWVPTSSERSNQGMLGRTLFTGAAAAAEFVPLYGATAEPAQAMDAICASLSRLILPLDVVVAGMGDDMHTASLFPGADHLRAALAEDAPPAMAMRAPGAAEPRVTLTGPALRRAGRIYLLITGDEKRQTLARAAGRDAETAPVRTLLDAGAEAWWAP